MQIDPVLLLADDIRQLEKQIHAECQRNEAQYDRERMDAVNLLVGRLRKLYVELLETEPSSALGAGELIRIAAQRLPFSQGRYSAHLFRISERLSAGQRLTADLIWLRALAEALAGDTGAQRESKTATLLALAIKGMAQPVVVYRATLPPRIPVRDLRELSHGPHEPFVPQSF